MQKFMAAVEIDRRRESKDAQLDRLTRQLREANAKAARAFDQGMSTAVKMMRHGATADDIEAKIVPEHVQVSRTRTHATARVAIPMELEDSDEHTEPMLTIPFAPGS